MKKGYPVVRVTIGKTNRDKLLILDLARRQVDHLGPNGIRAKRNQTNERYLKKGYLRFPFRRRRDALVYIARLEMLDDPSIRHCFMINPNRLR